MDREFLEDMYTVAQHLAKQAARLERVIEREIELAGGVITELPDDDGDWKAFLEDHPELA